MARVLIVGGDALLTRSWVRALWRQNHEARAIKSTRDASEASADGWRFEVAIFQAASAEEAATIADIEALADPQSVVALIGDPPPALAPDVRIHCQVLAQPRPGNDRDLMAVIERCLAEREAAQIAPKPTSGVRRRFPSNPSAKALLLPVVRTLVIDDDLSFANGCARLLATVGCDTIVASDGAEALALILLRDFDLVFCDVDLPRLGGPALLQEIRARNVQVPFVLMSAGAPRADPSRSSLVFLRKPIAPQTLLAVVDEVRARPRRASLNKGSEG